MNKNRKKLYYYLKSFFDFFFSFFLIIFLSPLIVFIIFLQIILNGFPIFYFGNRSGKNGKIFKIIKFRTMVKNSEKSGGDTTAKNDKRITKFGRFLRRTKIDEIPQLFNVLKGEMSFVGPRPELPFYTNQYSELEKVILFIKPGITDFSSIKFINLDQEVGAFDSDNIYEKKILKEKNALRIKYYNELSFSTDFKIIVLTIVKVLIKTFNFRR